MILVTGATGTVGSEVVRVLCMEREVATRALVRSPEKADALRGYDCETAVGDYGDPQSLDEAMRGVDAVFLAAPFGPEQPALEKGVIDAAIRVGIRVVKLGALGWDTGGYGRIGDIHADIVEHLRASGLPHTVLAPNDFLQNLFTQAASIQESSVFAMPSGDAPASSVDARDVAAVAAHVLISEGHDGASYVVTGPAALTRSDIAQRLSTLLSRDITYVDAAPAQARQGMLAAGLDEWRVDGLLELYEAARAGRSAAVTDEVRKATGRDARSVEDFLQDYRNAFA